MKTKKVEEKLKKDRKEGYNISNQPELAAQTGKLLTRAELELLRSAELCKLLRLKKVPGRSKLGRKAARARGARFGRKPNLDAHQQDEALERH